MKSQMIETNRKTIKRVAIVMMSLSLLTVIAFLPHDEFHGWWIFGYTEHVVPAPYLVASAWLIALTYMFFFVRWYARQLSDPLDWQRIGSVVFISGLIAVAIASVIELAIGLTLFANIEEPYHTYLQAPLAGPIEEVCKFAAMWVICRHWITDIKTGVFFAVLCALGFAFIENIVYFITHQEVMFLRGDPAHAVFSSFWGAAYGACKAKELPWRKLWFKWLPIGILFHATFNTPLMLILYPLSLWIAVRFIFNYERYANLILGRVTFRGFLWPLSWSGRRSAC